MAEPVAADPEMAAVDCRLRTAPGDGPIVAATLIAEIPELGQLTAAASRPSRARPPLRATGPGAWATAPSAAAVRSSGRCSPSPRCTRRADAPSSRSSTPAGKPAKAALVATARKLHTTLDAMLATGTDYRCRIPA